MLDIGKMNETIYRLENVNGEDSVEDLVIELAKLHLKSGILDQKISQLMIDKSNIDNKLYEKARDILEEKLKDVQLETLITKTMEYLVYEYSMESLSDSGNYYYVDIDNKVLIVSATLNKDSYYALKDMGNLKKIITTNFIENTILDINLYNTKTMYMKYKEITYNLDIDNMEKNFIQDGIYEHFNMDIDYNVDFDKVNIVDLENGSYVMYLPITFNSVNWDKIINEIEKNGE